MDRDVALPAGAHDRRTQLGLCRALDVVGGEAVEAAHEDMVATEREIGVREAQHVGLRETGRRRRRVGIGWRLWGQVGIAFRRNRRAARRLGIEEALGLGQARDPFHASGRFTGVSQACLEADARIGRIRGALLRGPFDGDDEQRGG